MNTSKRNWWAAGLFAGFLLIVVMLGFPFFFYIRSANLGILLPLLVVYGVVALLASLTVVAVVLAALNLSDPKGALGLPDGSVRALIALSLILIFTIVSVFLLWHPLENVQSDLAKQILTTVSTLVVAVAGFYFGSRAAEARGVSEQPSLSLRILKPDSRLVELDKAEGTELTIEVEARGAAVSWVSPPQGDTDGKIVQVKPGKFTYTRGSKAEPIVTLRFDLVDHPEVTAELLVIPPRSGR
jgi:hypothetical protein